MSLYGNVCFQIKIAPPAIFKKCTYVITYKEIKPLTFFTFPTLYILVHESDSNLQPNLVLISYNIKLEHKIL